MRILRKCCLVLLTGVILMGSLVACELSLPMPTASGATVQPANPAPITNPSPTIQTQYRIPADSQIPPDDVLQQINFYAAGGGNCGGYHCIDFNDTRVRLSGYDPHQELRVFVYRRTEEVSDPDQPGLEAVGTFVVEWGVSVDSSGFAALDVTGGDPDDFEFIVVDARTGKMLIYSSIAPDNPVIPQWEPGDRVLAYPAAVGIDMYAGPGYEQGVVWTVAGGTTVTIVMNPMVGDGERWWLVRLDNGRSGWVAESQLIPIDATQDSLPASTSTAQNTEWEHSIPSSFQVPPDDVLQQISFYAAGGGPGMPLVLPKANSVVLSDFDANQSLRVLVYQRTHELADPERPGVTGLGRFVTEWRVTVNSSGDAELTISGGDPSLYELVALDADSAECVACTSPDEMPSCPFAPGGGWRPGNKVVVNPPGRELELYASRGYNQPVVGFASAGEVMEIASNPAVQEEERWWLIRSDDSKEGWVSELWLAPFTDFE